MLQLPRARLFELRYELVAAGCPRDLDDTKEVVGRDESVFRLYEGGVWADSVDVNRMLLHAGLPGLESMGGKPNLDAIGDRCPKDDVDLIVIGGADHLEYSICEVCGGIWLDDKEMEQIAGHQDGNVFSGIVRLFRADKKHT